MAAPAPSAPSNPANRPGWIAPGRAQASTFANCRNSEDVIAFARDVFDAQLVRPVLHHDDGRVWNAELNIGDSTVMIGEASENMDRPAFIYVHVPDADATIAKALAHGATQVMPPQMQFYGDDDGGVEDTGGNWWWIGTHCETLSPEEMETRARTTGRRRAEGPTP